MDGNKRTARIVSNAILMNEKYCLISFRTVDSIDIRKQCCYFMSKTTSQILKKSLLVSLSLQLNHIFKLIQAGAVYDNYRDTIHV